MKEQPVSLALVVVIFMLIAMFWFSIEKSAQRAQEREQAMFNEQSEVRQLLAKCVVPSQGQVPPGLTPTLTLIATRDEVRDERLRQVLEPQAPLLDMEGERKIMKILR